jgi:integrase
VLDYRQAEGVAREWIARHHRIVSGLEPESTSGSAAPYSVGEAIADYLDEYAARGGKALSRTRQAATAHILPALGELAVGRLTQNRLKDWHRALAASPVRLRAKRGQMRFKDVSNDPEAVRRRRSTANRVLTILKSALNHARSEGKVACSADAWATIKAFREADKPKVRYLLDDEIIRFVNVCAPDARALVTGALLTGCRYGELASMTAGDFDSQVGTLTIGRSKGGKPRHVALTDEGRAFFEQMTANKTGALLIFERDELVRQATREIPAQTARVGWGRSDQSRFMREASAAARVMPAVSFHDLRHTYGSRLAMRGVPMAVIASQLGHSDTRMTERHYAHLSPSYVADTVRRLFGTLGIVSQIERVVLLHRAAS